MKQLRALNSTSLAALCSALMLVLIFPGFGLSFLAPVALTPLLYALTRGPAIWPAYAAGVASWGGVCYWIQFTLVNHGGTGDGVGWLLFALFCLAKGLQMAVFAWGARKALRSPWAAAPSVAGLWTLLEWSHQYTGFAWLQLGNAAIGWPVLPRLAPWTGVYGLSFLLALTAATLVKRQWGWLALLLVPFLLPALPSAAPETKRAWVVQPNLPEEEPWTPDSVARMNARLRELSRPQGAANIIVWPEVPAPIYDTDANLPAIARQAQTGFLAGVVSRAESGAPLNSAVFFSPEGRLLSKYDKVNLVPFGEFVPWPFGLLTRKISSEAGDYQAGAGIVVADGVGAFICYESVFPTYIRGFAKSGARVLFNLSNDGWFGKSAARFQHLEIVRMRAVENGRWIVRVTNNGITAAIDPAGRIRAQAPPYSEQTASFGYGEESATTFYTRHGDWFLWVCGGLAILGLAHRAR